MASAIDRYRHDTLTGREFKAQLTRLKMSEGEFSRLTGTRLRSLQKWIHEDGPPFHVRLILDLMEDAAIREKAHAIAERYLMAEEEYQAARDGGG